MIRRVTTPRGPTALSVVGLPPGTPTGGPLRLVYMDPAGVHTLMMAGDPIVTADGAPLMQYGADAGWGRVVPAGRL